MERGVVVDIPRLRAHDCTCSHVKLEVARVGNAWGMSCLDVKMAATKDADVKMQEASNGGNMLLVAGRRGRRLLVERVTPMLLLTALTHRLGPRMRLPCRGEVAFDFRCISHPPAARYPVWPCGLHCSLLAPASMPNQHEDGFIGASIRHREIGGLASSWTI